MKKQTKCLKKEKKNYSEKINLLRTIIKIKHENKIKENEKDKNKKEKEILENN